MNSHTFGTAQEKTGKFLYSNIDSQRIFKKLLDGIVYGNQCGLLVGPFGVGKTKMLYRLIDILGDAIKPIYFDKAYQYFDDLIVDLMQILNLDFESKQDLEGLVSNFESLKKGGPAIVLIFDNVDRYSEQMISQLFTFVDGIRQKKEPISLIFSGQPALLDIASDDCFQNIITARYDLAPLAIQEIENYVHKYLKYLGLDGEVTIDDAAINKIVDLSRGVPGVINKILEDVISIKASPSGRITGELIEQSALLIVEQNKEQLTSSSLDSRTQGKVFQPLSNDASTKGKENLNSDENKKTTGYSGKERPDNFLDQVNNESSAQDKESRKFIGKKNKINVNVLQIIPLILLIIAIVLINYGVQIKQEYQSKSISTANSK